MFRLVVRGGTVLGCGGGVSFMGDASLSFSQDAPPISMQSSASIYLHTNAPYSHETFSPNFGSSQ